MVGRSYKGFQFEVTFVPASADDDLGRLPPGAQPIELRSGIVFDAMPSFLTYVKELTAIAKNIPPGVIEMPLGAWLAYRAKRKVKLKFGDVEVEASTLAEVKAALQLIDDYQSRQTDRNNKR